MKIRNTRKKKVNRVILKKRKKATNLKMNQKKKNNDIRDHVMIKVIIKMINAPRRRVQARRKGMSDN